MNNASVRNAVALRDQQRREGDSERLAGHELSIGDFVAVRWWDGLANPVGWQHKIVKVKEILSDGIIDESDEAWRKPKQGCKRCIHGHATMVPPTVMQFLCNQVEWEIREIFWE